MILAHSLQCLSCAGHFDRIGQAADVCAALSVAHQLGGTGGVFRLRDREGVGLGRPVQALMVPDRDQAVFKLPFFLLRQDAAPKHRVAAAAGGGGIAAGQLEGDRIALLGALQLHIAAIRHIGFDHR